LDTQSLQGANGPQSTDQSGFHLQDSWAVGAAVANAKWHLSDRPQVPNGVVMAEKQNRLEPRKTSPEFCTNCRTSRRARQPPYVPRRALELAGEEARHAVDVRLRSARRFDLDGLSQTAQHRW